VKDKGTHTHNVFEPMKGAEEEIKKEVHAVAHRRMIRFSLSVHREEGDERIETTIIT